MNETEEQRQNRFEKDRERHRSISMNETEEQRRTRLKQPTKPSKTNRLKKKFEKKSYENICIDRNNIGTQFSIGQSWPEPIARELKKTPFTTVFRENVHVSTGRSYLRSLQYPYSSKIFENNASRTNSKYSFT